MATMTSFNHIGRSLLMRWAAVAVLTGGPVNAAPVSIETIGAEKCGGRVTAYEVEFLAPDSAALEATAKSVVDGLTSLTPGAVTLSLDGRECTDARCLFQARKGETYKLAATTKLRSVEQLCIVVARP
jgi:hypothetical protein